MRKLTIKAASLSVDDEGTITGIAWPFGSPDSEGDVIGEGALRLRGTIPMLWQHDQSEVLGGWSSIAETSRGIEVVGKMLVKEIPRAAEAYSLVKSKSLSGLSLGFLPLVVEPNEFGGDNILEAELAEISLVSVPAHKGAKIITVKSAKSRKGTTMAKAAVKRIVRKELESDNDNIEQVIEEVLEESTLEDRVTALETDVAEIRSSIGNVEETTENIEKSLSKLTIKSARPGVIRQQENPAEMKRKAFAEYLRHGERAALATKSLVKGNDAKGGYVAPPEFVNEMLREIVEFSPVRDYAHVGSTGNNSVILPGRVGTTNAKWKGELETQEESTFDFREVEIPIHEINTYVDVSNQLLEDAAIDVEAEVRMAFAEDLGVKEGYAFIHGTGVKQPEGFLTRDDIAVFDNDHANNINADALIAMLYSHPAYYRNDGGWMMNGTTLGKLRTLKDGQGNFLWQPSYQAGQPETLLGRPVIELIDMPDAVAGAVPIVYGDLNEGYRIYDRVDMEVLVNPYKRAEEGMTRFHVRKRLGAGVVKPKALRKFKMKS